MPSCMKNRQHELFSAISRVRYRPTLRAGNYIRIVFENYMMQKYMEWLH